MTQREFEQAAAAIREEPFSGSVTSPIEFALKRAEFVEAKLRKMVALADKTTFKTARKQKEVWLREIERAKAKQQRFKQSLIEQSARR